MSLIQAPQAQQKQNPDPTISGPVLRDLAVLIQTVYLSDSRPWIIGYSGGKDSTTTLQLIWNALAAMPREQLTKPVYIISSDTLVETPVLVDYIRSSLERMNEAAKAQGLPFSAHLVRPPVENTFWVNMIGKGYPAPYNRFRWCTDRLKINPANTFIKNTVNEHGEVVLVLGVRKAESATRRQVMELHKRVGNQLSRHSQLVNAWVFTPIEDWNVSDVWTYLLAVRSPWGNKNRDLVTMYKNSSGECPLVVDKSTPTCGNSRFGCWTCTVVERDRSMESIIENGEDWMQPLLDVRNWLTETRNPERKHEFRSHRRRSGRVDTWQSKTDGEDSKDRIIWGPYTMEMRREILRRVLKAQVLVREDGPDENAELISEAELHEIRRLWRHEEGDWEDHLPGIYADVTGETLAWLHEDDGGATREELEQLSAVANAHGLAVDMLKEMLDIERSYRGMSYRSRVHNRLAATLKKDWRSREEVFAELEIAGNNEWADSSSPAEQAE